MPVEELDGTGSRRARRGERGPTRVGGKEDQEPVEPPNRTDGPAGMVDLHTHLLPGVDDGVRTMAEAVEQLREARAQGIEAVVCTPHVWPGPVAERRRQLNERRRIHRALVETAAAEGELPEVGFGSEVLIHDQTVDLNDPGLRLNGTAYALVEVGFGRERFDDLREIFLKMMESGWRPIVAHVERYVHLQGSDALLSAWREDGVLAQVNASSVADVHSPRVRERAWQILESGLADVVASDVHGSHMRSNHMREAWDLVAARLGLRAARQLFVEIPSSVYQGAHLTTRP